MIFKPKALSEVEKDHILEALHKGPGYVVVDLFDAPPPSSVLESLLRVAQDVRFPSEGIDNGTYMHQGGTLQSESEIPDSEQKRRAVPLPNFLPELNSLLEFLNMIPTLVGPHVFNKWRQVVGWNILMSLPGLVPQIYHKDFDLVVEQSSDDVTAKGNPRRRDEGRRDFPLPVHQMPLSLIMSFDDNTCWYTKSGCDHPPYYTRVQIKAGSALIFRGDISHAGPECVTNSREVRLHAYFDHPSLTSRYRYGPDHYKAIFYTFHSRQAKPKKGRTAAAE